MQFDGIAGLEPVEAVTTRAERDQELGRTDFLKMLVAQLENQDPLNPQDGTEFTAQLAQFSSLEQLVAMRASIDQLAEQLGGGSGTGVLGSGASAELLAASLIGREVFAAGNAFTLGGERPGGFDPASDYVPDLAFDLAEPATGTRVTLLNDQGVAVGDPIELGRQAEGRVQVPRDALLEQLEGLPAGDYTFGVDARYGAPGAPGEPVSSTPYVTGLVSAASLSEGEPILRLGGTRLPLADVLEVRRAEEVGR